MTDAPVNKPIQVANEIIHSIEYDFLLKLAVSYLEKQIPWLNLPVVKQLFEFVMKYYANQLYPVIKRLVDFKIIDSQVASQYQGYEKARAEYKSALAQGNVDEINISSQNLNSSFDRLIHFDGF